MDPHVRRTFLALGVYPMAGGRAAHLALVTGEPEAAVARRLDRLVPREPLAGIRP